MKTYCCLIHVFVVLIIIAGSNPVCDGPQCQHCTVETLEEWMDCLSLKSKYDCFVNEGVTEVKDLLLFKSPINNIHLQDLEILQNKCDLNTFQFVKLKRNIEFLFDADLKINRKNTKLSSQSVPEATQVLKSLQETNSNDLCEYKYTFIPVILRTYHPDDNVMHSDDAMVKSELIGILDKDALNYFDNIQVGINMVGFDDMNHSLLFTEYTFDNSLNDDRLITFVGDILNSTADRFQSNIATSELFRFLDQKELDIIFDSDAHATKFDFMFVNDTEERVDCIGTVFNYTVRYWEGLKAYETIDFKFVGFVETEVLLAEEMKNKACRSEYGGKAKGMKYDEMFAVNKDEQFMKALPDLKNGFEFPICGNQATIDKEKYQNMVVHQKWPQKIEDLDHAIDEPLCYLPCKQDYKRSYLFTVDYYIL